MINFLSMQLARLLRGNKISLTPFGGSCLITNRVMALPWYLVPLFYTRAKRPTRLLVTSVEYWTLKQKSCWPDSRFGHSFFPRSDGSYCDGINPFLRADLCFGKGYVGSSQWLGKNISKKKRINRCIGRCKILEIILKMTLNTRTRTINQW